ncbi:uncharacterized protein LOC100160940 isoform X2 [Acyrthosiphon pisum]|uniref:MI domain-containing protein n=1 Tax=Acyrthosiphon pisum TaxID=7029 RepID=A0A8R2D5H7_ACYPI|nr:uncharacterized protein LOC100160940 isoform X2 [Acyrthosiphon pisum]|eukprot:XP_016661051.1 PREDICTED: uncharacterized protein LOC100160940 isoform X2 [Acyrthosiphon pisum]
MEFSPPKEMSFVDNISEQWNEWYQQFNIFLIASGKANETDESKINILLNHIGTQGIEIYNNFKKPKKSTDITYDNVVKWFSDYCEPRKNIIFQRYKFSSCVQKEGQTFDNFVTELKTLSSLCEFKEEDNMIRDRIVFGIKDAETKNKLLNLDNLTLEKAETLCRTREVKGKEIQEMTMDLANILYMDREQKIGTKNKGQVHVPTHVSQRQQAVYLPRIVAYQGTSNHPAYYPFGPHQASQKSVIMPYVNYPTNQQVSRLSGMFYSQSTRPIQMTNLPQGPQNPPVANMSNAQNSHGQSLIVQSQPMDMAPNTQPLQQVSQQPSTTPMQITEASSRPAKKKTLIKIIDPNTGRDIYLNNSLQGPPNADELEKMKVQSQFQSHVQSAFKKDDTKLSDNNSDINILKVRSILNKITPDNIPSITEHLKALPIDTIERLEKTIDLVFEKAIEEHLFAPCSILCSAMQFIQVSTKDGKTASFKKLIINKCQSLFELDKARVMDSAKKLTEINLCKDLEKKKELQLEFEENERKRKQSVGNCRFMGELFAQKILTPSSMLYCIVSLVTKHDEESLECLCILLKTVGKKLEQSYDLNDTFDKLTALTSSDMKSKISSRMKFMIQDVIYLRRHKWISEKQDHLQGGGYKSCRVPSMMLQFAQSTPSINSSSSSQPKETVEMSSEMANKISMKCKNILLEYEQMQNLDDIIYSLSEDETSVIRTRHEEFVTSMSLITLDNSPITRTTVAGKIFAELLSKKILSMDAITRGIDAVLKEWNDFLMDYPPQFFSYIAAIIAPLLLSQNASFDFNNLKDFCTSIQPDKSSIFFTEVLNKILNSKETQNIKEQLGGILWIYNKWKSSENVTLDVFMPNNQINKYFKKDQIGILILSIVIYDKMKLTNNKLLYNILQSWICTNISEEIIKNPLFVKSLTIAIVIVCLKLNHSYEDFFDPVHVELLSHFIEFKPLPEHEIQAREVQCMYGIQIMAATLKHPGGMVLKLFNKLYHHRVISKESFELFIQEYEEITEK